MSQNNTATTATVASSQQQHATTTTTATTTAQPRSNKRSLRGGTGATSITETKDMAHSSSDNNSQLMEQVYLHENTGKSAPTTATTTTSDTQSSNKRLRRTNRSTADRENDEEEHETNHAPTTATSNKPRWIGTVCVRHILLFVGPMNTTIQ